MIIFLFSLLPLMAYAVENATYNCSMPPFSIEVTDQKLDKEGNVIDTYEVEGVTCKKN